MRAFAEAQPSEAIVQQLAAQLPWFHNCELLDEVKGPAEGAWRIEQAIENGWSRVAWKFARPRQKNGGCPEESTRRSGPRKSRSFRRAKA